MIMSQKKNENRILETLFLGSLTGMSILCGFGYTLSHAKRQNTQLFNKGFNSGVSLALKALAYGSVFALSGVTIVSLIVWKSLDSMKEYRGILSKNTKKQEFDSITDLMIYLSELKK